MVACLCLLGAVAVVVNSGAVADDALITYRYAQHLASGVGWHYNAGGVANSANGATSPLYVVALAAVVVTGVSAHHAASMIAVISIAVSAICSYLVLRRACSALAGGVGAVLVVANPWFPYYKGMESALVLALAAALLLVAFSSDVEDRQVLLGLLAGLAVTARADMVLLVGAVGLVLLFRLRRVLWRAAAVFAGVLGISALMLWAATGSPLPDTLDAKIAQGRSGLWSGLASGWIMAANSAGLWPWLIALFVLAGIGAIAGLARERTRELAAVLLAWGGLHLLAYIVAFNVPDYYWYYANVLFCLALLAGIGADAITAPVRNATGQRAAGAVVVVALLVVCVQVFPTGGAPPVAYQRASAWINAHTRPDQLVAATEIGYIGYATRRPIVDYLGLLDRASIEDLERRDFRSWIYRTQPDVFVVHSPLWPFEAAVTAPGFDRAYELTAIGSGVWIFVRQTPLDRRATGPITLIPRRLWREVDRVSLLRDDAERRAFESTLVVVLSRFDLQAAFLDREGQLNLASTLAWADQVSRNESDADSFRLAPHHDAIARLAERAGPVGAASVVIADPLPAP